MRRALLLLGTFFAAACDGPVDSVEARVLAPVGDESPPSPLAPEPAPPLVARLDVPQVVLGHGFTCALSPSTHVSCWGRLSATNDEQLDVPTSLPEGDDLVRLASDGGTLCGLRADGSMKCVAAVVPPEYDRSLMTPGADVALPAPAIDLVAGARFYCAILLDHRVACVGYIGDGSGETCPTDGDDTRPCFRAMHVVEAFGSVRGLAASSGHVCAVRDDGATMCMGSNGRAELGSAEPASHGAPVVVSGIAEPSAIAVGPGRSAAVVSGRVVYWGDRPWGPDVDLSAHTEARVEVPELAGATAVYLNERAFCGRVDRSVRCVVPPARPRPTPPPPPSRRPRGRREPVTFPVRQPAPIPPVEIRVDDVVDAVFGDEVACFVHTDHAIDCMGANGAGAIGSPWVEVSEQPVPVLDASGHPAGHDAYFGAPLGPESMNADTQRQATFTFDPLTLEELVSHREPPAQPGTAATVRSAMARNAEVVRACLTEPPTDEPLRILLALWPGTNRAKQVVASGVSREERDCVVAALAIARWPMVRDPLFAYFTITR